MGKLSVVILDFANPDATTVESTRAEFDVLSSGRFVLRAKPSWAVRIRRSVDPRMLPPDDLVAEKEVSTCVFNNLSQFDLVWLHNLRTANSLQRWQWPRSVMDIDDVPSSYERTIWQTPGPIRPRIRAAWRSFFWKRRERCLFERFSVLAVCSETDRRYLAGRLPVHVVPNGFDCPASEPFRHLAVPPRIGFIGRFGYPPNAEGMRWFVEQCWPAIKLKVSSARLRIVGRGSDGPLRPEGDDIDGLGWVADSAAEIATWSAMIVPVHTGAGTRVKVAEAFSRKCPLVSTSLGAYGYRVTHGSELLIADSAPNFAAACVRLIEKPAEGLELAERAWHRFVSEWTWDAVSPQIWAAADDCLRIAHGQLPPASLPRLTPVTPSSHSGTPSCVTPKVSCKK